MTTLIDELRSLSISTESDGNYQATGWEVEELKAALRRAVGELDELRRQLAEAHALRRDNLDAHIACEERRIDEIAALIARVKVLTEALDTYAQYAKNGEMAFVSGCLAQRALATQQPGQPDAAPPTAP